MLRAVHKFIPILTTDAGSCLTAANWQEVNSEIVACYLDSLLLKPGFDLLNKIPDFARYMGWTGSFVLNASNLTATKEGIFKLKSPYDGSKIELTYSELFEIIWKLKPNAVLVPKNSIRDLPEIWDESITLFIAEEDLLMQEFLKPHGVYFNVNSLTLTNTDFEQFNKWFHLPRYISGTLDIDLINSLHTAGIEFIESDEPASSGMKGHVYSKAGIVDLTDKKNEMQFELIDLDCVCPTCSQKFTKAYLHHLYLHTPLLCQRLLIQHNVYYPKFGS